MSRAQSSSLTFVGWQQYVWLSELGPQSSPYPSGSRSFVALQVVLHWTDDTADPQHAVSLDALRRLEGFKDARGRQLKVHLLIVN